MFMPLSEIARHDYGCTTAAGVGLDGLDAVVHTEVAGL